MRMMDLLDKMFPPIDTDEIDVELRIALVVGSMGAGKTTLAQTLSNELLKKYGDKSFTIYGYWLHKIIPEAVELTNGKKYILIVLDDATGFISRLQSRKLVSRDMYYFFRLRHFFKGQVEENTAKIGLLILTHSYMLLEKHVRHAHMILIKSLPARWQRYEHEDLTLKFLDSVLVRELTRMRFSSRIDDVLSALNKAIVLNLDGTTEVLKYRAIKGWPKRNYYENLDIGIDLPIHNEGSKFQVPPITYKRFIKILRSVGIKARDTKMHEAYKKLMIDMGYTLKARNGEINVAED